MHVKLIKANKCLFILRSLRKEGYSQVELDHLFSSIVLPSITYGLPVYGASEAELTAMQCFLDGCYKRKYTSKSFSIKHLLKKQGGGSSPKTLYNDVKCTRADSQGYNNGYFRDKQTRTFRVTKGGPFYSPLTHWHLP